MSFANYEKEKFEKEMQESDKLILLDFWNEGCAVCKNLERVLEALIPKYSELAIYSVNALESEDICQKYSIMTVPSLVFIKDGTVKKRTIGFKSMETLSTIIETILSGNVEE